MSDEKGQPWAKFADAPVVQVVAVSALPIKSTEPIPVVVVDLNMSFGSMVTFMVKWVLASIPAFLILAVLALVVGAFAQSFLSRLVP